MATSGSNTVVVTEYDNLVFSWEETSQSIANNSSVVSWKMELVARGASGAISSSKLKPWQVIVNGTEYSGTVSHGISGNSTKTLASGETTITHNADGSKTFSYYFFMTFEGLVFAGKQISNKSGSGTGTLTDIPRAATITAAPNFNDEANPTITYSNPAGTAVSALEACISLDGSADDIAYRDISKTGTSYTFNLTDAERNVLRKAAANANSITVRFYVATTIGGTTYRKYLAKTLTIVNANPTLSPTAVDGGSVSTVLTGDANNKVIKYYNSMNVAANAAALKGATIKSYKISCGGKSITTASGKLSSVESGTFTFSATDSRGNTTTKTLTKTLINYIKLTCNLAAKAPTADGNMSFTISGNYFNGSFGAVSNTLAVQYRIKTGSGSYSDWIAATATVNSNKYSATVNLTGLDYRTSYTIQARAADEIFNGDTEPIIESAAKTVKTTPVFDWGADDFQFNVPVYMGNGYQLYSRDTSGNDVMMMSLNTNNQSFFGYGSYFNELGSTYFDGNSVYVRSKNDINLNASGSVYVNGADITNNKLLWSGTYYMTASHKITLAEAVSKQPHGIVLVFSAYEDGAAADKNFNSFFVPKYLVANKAGYGSCFTMAASKFGNIATKYLYINDTTIAGNDQNGETGTAASGITFTNNAYVLRYVIGV